MGMVHFPETDCVFPQMTSLAQSNVEQILVEEVEKLQGGAIHWGTELVDYEQHGDHVLARYKSGDEGMIRISAKYIVGADGCHSKVRKQDQTWTYDGHAIKSRFAMADLVLDGRDVARIKNRQVIFYHAKGKTPSHLCIYHYLISASSLLFPGACFFLPLPHKPDDGKISVRMVANMGAYDVDDGPRVSHGLETSGTVLTLDKVKEVISERMVGMETNIVSSSGVTYFHVNERIANGFRRGRAFVIGGKERRVGLFYVCTHTFSCRCCSLPFSCWWSRDEHWVPRW
jgi:2-polyprenyl-6-methoxyphenol hydroxylase-like FAD-dependent oxidoreductase